MDWLLFILTVKERTMPKGNPGVLKVRAIKWKEYLGFETVSLPTIAGTFYVLGELARMNPRTYNHRYLVYTVDIAECFAKYLLASCLGEWRHRTKNVKAFEEETSDGAKWLLMIPCRKGHEDDNKEGITRIRAQGYATRIMHDRKLWVDVLWLLSKWLKEKQVGFYGSIGGENWSRIAETTYLYLVGKLPAVVFVDHCFDIVHNGGRLFDKAVVREDKETGDDVKAFQHEATLRKLLSDKKDTNGLFPFKAHIAVDMWQAYQKELDNEKIITSASKRMSREGD